MEMRKKKSKANVKILANKIMKCKKKLITEKCYGNAKNNRIVIDVNVNLKGIK